MNFKSCKTREELFDLLLELAQAENPRIQLGFSKRNLPDTEYLANAIIWLNQGYEEIIKFSYTFPESPRFRNIQLNPE